MYLDQTIGCIGIGNMGSAIVSCLSTKISPESIVCFDIDDTKLEKIHNEKGVLVTTTLKELCDKSNIIIIAVKPDVIMSVIKDIKNCITNKVIVSVAAGISIKAIEDVLKSSQKIVRVMPNTPALIGEGMTVISPNENVDKESLKPIETIFNILGKVLVFPEKFMDAVTAISGCGPAYFYTLLQAMTDGGVKLGIPRDKALLLSAQTMYGTAKMVLDGNEEPIVLRGRVTSPGGSTIEAVYQLEKAGFSGIIMDAIEAASIKSKELGRKNR